MKVVNLWRRETVQLKTGVLRAQSAQQVFVPFDAKVRVQSSLHQNTGAAELNRLVNLSADFVDGPHVGIGRAGPSIERAEGAHDVADVRIVDVAIDDVSDDIVRVASLANFISGRTDARHVI